MNLSRRLFLRQSVAATRQREAARVAYAAIAPALPDELIRPRMSQGSGWLAEDERDCEGKIVWPEPLPPLNTAYPPRRIYSAHAISRSGNCEDGSPASRAYWTKIRNMAAGYEAACEAARQTAGVDTALERHFNAEEALRKLAVKAKDIEPLSLTGLVIKAEVLMAYAACGTEARQWALWLGETLPHQIVALFGRKA